MQLYTTKTPYYVRILIFEQYHKYFRHIFITLLIHFIAISYVTSTNICFSPSQYKVKSTSRDVLNFVV